MSHTDKNLLEAQKQAGYILNTTSPDFVIDFLCEAIRQLQIVDSRIGLAARNLSQELESGTISNSIYIARANELWTMRCWVIQCDVSVRGLATKRLRRLLMGDVGGDQ